MFFSRADGKMALMHVLENVFELPTDHLLTAVLTQDGIVEIGDILCMPYDDILGLAYTDEKGNKIPVGKCDTHLQTPDYQVLPPASTRLLPVIPLKTGCLLLGRHTMSTVLASITVLP